MTGLGTIINVTAIVAGGLAGVLFGKRLKNNIQSTLITACGVCVIFLGIAGAMEKMLTVSNGVISSGKTMLIIGSIALGALTGELIGIEAAMERFGEWLKKKTGSSGDNLFVEGFVNASLTVCIGAMAVIGSIRDGVYGDYSMLAAKAVLDMIIVMIMAASHGKGCIFSAIPVGLFQGILTLIAFFTGPVLNSQALDNLSLVGSILIFCVGLNLIRDKKIKAANLLPSLVFAVAAAYINI